MISPTFLMKTLAYTAHPLTLSTSTTSERLHLLRCSARKREDSVNTMTPPPVSSVTFMSSNPNKDAETSWLDLDSMEDFSKFKVIPGFADLSDRIPLLVMAEDDSDDFRGMSAFRRSASSCEKPWGIFPCGLKMGGYVSEPVRRLDESSVFTATNRKWSAYTHIHR